MTHTMTWYKMRYCTRDGLRCSQRACDNVRRGNPTTSCLTTTTLTYAVGAGITAAAGTRLALQSILVSPEGRQRGPVLRAPSRAETKDLRLSGPARA